jgi:hypothetical protein
MNMMIRTSETTVTFQRSFMIPSLFGRYPAGTYRVVADDLETGHDGIDNQGRSGVILITKRRLATQLQVPALSMFKTETRIVDINAEELAKAIEQDKQPAVAFAAYHCEIWQ